MSEPNIQELQEKVISALKTVYDPEIPVDIWELGLIYELRFNKQGDLHIVMTLTSPACPVAESLPQEVKDKAKAIEGIGKVELSLVWEPMWNKDMMSEEAKLELGFL